MKKLFAVLCLSFVIAACDNSIREYNNVIGDKPHAEYGEQVQIRYGALAGTEGVNANGVGFARQYENGTWVVTINLNVEMAPEGKSYTARLRDSGGEFYSIGTMNSLVGDVRHSATKDFTVSLDDADMVEVLLGDTVIATGTLRAPAKP